MSVQSSAPRETGELDVRDMRKPERHPAIFAAYGGLAVGEAFILVNDHDPQPLRGEFEVDHRGSHRWEYLSRGTPEWRIRITKLVSTPLPLVLLEEAAEVEATDPAGADGTVWRLQAGERDLDAAIVVLSAGEEQDAHVGPDLDVLLHVLSGNGSLTTEVGAVELKAGQLVWLPRRSRRRLSAGSDGLRCLTVNQRRQNLALTS